MSEERYMQLYDGILTSSSIGCDECGKLSYKAMDGAEAAEEFYADGWRKLKEEIYCPNCVNTKKKNKQL